jgi:MFS family permease
MDGSDKLQVSSALINPGFVSMSKSLGVTVQQASYCATVGLLFQGVTPMFFVPFANVYGRRILYTVCTDLHVQINKVINDDG